MSTSADGPPPKKVKEDLPLDDFKLEFNDRPYFTAKKRLSAKGGAIHTSRFTFSQTDQDPPAGGVLVIERNKCSSAGNEIAQLNTCTRRDCRFFHAALGDVVQFGGKMSGASTLVLGRAHAHTLESLKSQVTVSEHAADMLLKKSQELVAATKRKRSTLAAAASLASGQDQEKKVRTLTDEDKTVWVKYFTRAGWAFNHLIAGPGELGPLSKQRSGEFSADAADLMEEIKEKALSIIKKGTTADADGKRPANCCGKPVALDSKNLCACCFAFTFCPECLKEFKSPHLVLCRPHPAWELA